MSKGLRPFIAAGFICAGIAGQANAALNVTYHLDGVDAGIASQIRNSVDGAIGYYHTYGGEFSKQLHVYYSSGVPTAQANYDGVITFGGSRNLRVAMHEIMHTLGVGTYWRYSQLMTSGTWDGPLANSLIQAWGEGSTLKGDSTHVWPYGLNYDSEDSETARRRCAQIMHAIQCDMGNAVKSPYGEKRIINRGSGKALDASRDNTDGSNVGLWGYWGGANQKWTVTNIGGDRFSIRTTMSGARGLDCGWSPSNGDNVVIWDYWAGEPQKWQLLNCGGDYYRINPHGNTGQCLDAYGTSDGDNVGLWSYWGGQNQQWTFLNP